jgi:hypothetical protein
MSSFAPTRTWQLKKSARILPELSFHFLLTQKLIRRLCQRTIAFPCFDFFGQEHGAQVRAAARFTEPFVPPCHFGIQSLS